MTSFFENVSLSEADPIFGAKQSFFADKTKDKLDLMVGVFSSSTSHKPEIFRAVKEAEKKLIIQEETKDYLPITGDSQYLKHTSQFVFGQDFDLNKLCSFQTPGGTSAISLGLSFIRDSITDNIYLSNPTWANHTKIAKDLGFNIHSYPYLNPKTKRLDTVAFLEAFENATENSCVLLQASAHNPTGLDLPFEVIEKFSQIVKKKKLLLFIDSAYQGLANSCYEDVLVLRYLVGQGHELFVSHSFSKSLGLYGERLGALFVITDKKHDHIKSQFEFKIRVSYSNPPRHASEIVKIIFKDEKLFTLWQQELQEKREHLFWVRKHLVKECSERFSIDLSYLEKGRGMWGLLPLDKQGVQELKKRAGIYLTGNGRINLSALHENSIKVLLDGLAKVEHLFI